LVSIPLFLSSRIPVDVDDRLGERRLRFLRDVVADAPQDAMRVLARVLIRVRLAVRERAVEIAADRDRRHRDRRARSELLLQRVVLGLAVGETQPPPVVVDDDVDVIRILERGSRAIVGRIVEVPARRGNFPDQLVEVMPVLGVGSAVALPLDPAPEGNPTVLTISREPFLRDAW
jgi:hypothetical protein